MRKVLLVEDEDLIRAGLRKILEEVIGGYRVGSEARDGTEALNLVESLQPDLILTDIRMIGMDGLEFVRELRMGGNEVPVVIISGYADFGYAREAVRLRVVEYILKPVDPAELAAVLERLFPTGVPREEEASYIVRRIHQIVHEHLAEDLSLRELASLLSLNPQYLSKLYKQQTGTNLSDYIAAERIAKARNLLTSTSLKIYEIAALCGYPGVKHFTGVFKKRTGKTPSQVRNFG